MKVTKEHLESLQKTINNVKNWIAEGEVSLAFQTLEMLSDSLGKSIERADVMKNEKIYQMTDEDVNGLIRATQNARRKSNTVLQKGDLVKIIDISQDGHELGVHKYLGVEAHVKEVDETWEYPYTLQATEVNIEGLEDYLWRAEDLHII